MKKKIVALCLVVALALTAVGGATLAYFTDKDEVKNEFTIGNIDIDLWENGSITDKDGNVVQEVVEQEQEGIKYEGLMPTYRIQKEPYITNTGKNDAYVRVAVVMNNVTPINVAIDEVYEAKGYTAEQIQEVYDNVFEGWGVNYSKRNVNGNNDRRMWMDDRDEPVLFNVDMFCKQPGNGSMFDVNNQFKSGTETDAEGFDYTSDSYYYDSINVEERIYVFYLKLEPNQGYKLFDGLNVPADFTAEQMKMFDGLKINIYADAIQTAGFDTAVDAFNALEAEHPLGYWN